MKLNPLSGQIPHSDSLFVTVTKLTALIRDFVIFGCLVANFTALGAASPVRPLEGALVIFVRKHTSQFRRASSVPLLWDVPNQSHKECVRVQALLYLRNFLRTPSPNLEGFAIVVPRLDCYPFLFWFWVFGDSHEFFLVLDHHFALLLDLKMYLVNLSVTV